MPEHNIIRKIRGRVSAGTRVFKARILALILSLVSPTSNIEDERRQELILNIILLFSIVFLTLLDATVIWNSIAHFPHYHGIHWSIFTLIVAACMALLIASKHGHARIVSYTIIGFYCAGSLYGGWCWGISLPATLLSFALISVTSSILVGSSFGFAMSGFLIVSLGVLSVHEIYSLGVLPWKYEAITATDVVTYSAILVFIAALSWLSNREIQKSLNRARLSENALAQERDLLEIKVKERTDELHRAQAERMAEISRIAEFGRLSQGLFHDLMTPLSSVALHMEKVRNMDAPEVHEARAYLQTAIAASHKMGNFMNLIRNHIRYNGQKELDTTDTKNRRISISEELYAVLQILKHKARDAQVTIRVHSDENIYVHANSVYFQRIFLNLISNAIDAHENTKNKEKRIDIEIAEKENRIVIIVSDNGPGIAPENLSRIFEPFFTTKTSDKGIGVGLSTVKSIVEEGLKGSIRVESQHTIGTSFIISFPS